MTNSLKLWPFDSRLSLQDKEDLLKYFGAREVLPSKRCGNTDAVIAIFERHADCEYAMKQLHQQDLGGGRRLIAVYDDNRCVKSSLKLESNDSTNIKKENKETYNKINEYEQSLNNISNKLHIKHPIPQKLKYLYPPPSPVILINIINIMASVPKFYTQVLHLMNKMNLPVPFGSLPVEEQLTAELLSIAEMLNSLLKKDEAVHKLDVEENIVYSSSESELESDSDDRSVPRKNVSINNVKRKRHGNKVISKKRKLELLKQSTNVIPHKESNPIKVNQVFECNNVPVKKLELNIPSELLEHTNSNNNNDGQDNQTSTGSFGVIKAPEVQNEELPLEERTPTSSKFISDSELQENRVTEADWPILPVFKNYQPGESSVKLYIKNLAKNTTEANLKYIYGKYIFWHNEEEVEKFNIRLMKEGRMKGQAFITFPTVDQAKQALSETNGYILNDKPIVVMFGRVK